LTHGKTCEKQKGIAMPINDNDDDAYADEPRRSRRSSERDAEPRRRREKKGGLGAGGILLIVGGVLAFACLIGIVVTVVLAYVGATVAVRAVDDIQKNMNVGMVAPGTGKIILTSQGRLMPNDPVKDLMRHKPFAIRLEKGKTYVIDLESNEMDSFLRLYDPKGRMVATDDDGGAIQNARIRHTADVTGNYEISASVFGGDLRQLGGAGFVLTVREEKD
jgi:hypothetical protein